MFIPAILLAFCLINFPSLADGQCVDSAGQDQCTVWKTHNFCTSTFYSDTMKVQNCQETCDLCNCKDNYPEQCPGWAAKGFCTNSFYDSPDNQYRKDRCMMTCNLCSAQ